ncbi:aminoglycoside phosphotransferase family protein [Streptomyces sp. HU2014]|uniref:phosphotransferase n=1 Tax=Streptomyces sp. HU2014 TaxID=2939414 RepID=UPI00200DB431|nr:phosphotransferase [Streptomyces sp. HU2014]UQI45566.1 aminoglycoside phosphotransferase family protein [Streptomyces sp. HU2014]
MSELLTESARPATAAELADLYAALDGRGLVPDTVVPSVVVVEVPGHDSLVPRLTERLGPFGVRVVALEAAAPTGPGAGRGPGRAAHGTYFLGGELHGWYLEPPAPAALTGTQGAQGTDSTDSTDSTDQAEPIASAVIAARLRSWAAATRPVPTVTRFHRPGSDSTGVVQFDAGDGPGTELVAKIGEAGMIRSETGFTSRTNDSLGGIGRDPLFPRLHGVRIEGHQGISIMEAAESADLEQRLFSDEARTELAPDAPGILAPYLGQLARWYRLTAGDQRPTSADYLYRERFHALREQPALRSTFRLCFGDRDLDEHLAAELTLPDGTRIPGYTAATAWLDEHAPGLLPHTGSQVHGDIYPTNMLRRAGGGPVFIDPRTVWEQRPRPDIGYGDPVFDLATLLHGLLPMPAILHAARQGKAAALFGDAFDPARPHDVSALRLPLRFSDRLRAMEDRLIGTAPGTEPAHLVRCRLYIGAACSLAGWLKYENTLRTPHAWTATYAYTVWYLSQARTVHEQHIAKELA